MTAAPEAFPRRLFLLGVGVILLVALVGTGIGVALGRRGGAAPSPGPVAPTAVTVPASIATMALVDEHGRRTSLAALHGRIVVFSDFLTSCQEQCPITTGALFQVERALRAAHLADRVVLVEATVDPGRDTPARLAAYARRTGVDWELLTGTPAQLALLWAFFGVTYAKVPEDSPPGIDWANGRPYTYDVQHSDETFLLGPDGNERFLVDGQADVHRSLPPRLASLLNAQGRQNLESPGLGAWTPDELLAALGSLLHAHLPG